MYALHDDKDGAAPLIVEPGDQRVLEPFIRAIALDVRIGVIRLQGVINDDEVAAAAGQSAADRSGQTKAAGGQFNLALRILLPDPHAGKEISIPAGFRDRTEVVGMFLGQIAGIGNADDAPRRVVSQDEGRKGDRRRYRLQRSRRHVDDQPRGLAATKPLERTADRFEMPTWHEGLARREGGERLLDKSVEMLAQERPQQQSGVSVHAWPQYPFQRPFR